MEALIFANNAVECFKFSESKDEFLDLLDKYVQDYVEDENKITLIICIFKSYYTLSCIIEI